MDNDQRDRRDWPGPDAEDEPAARELVDAALATLRKQYNVDEDRIYATGFSNGAGFTYLLWAMRPDVFAAYAPVAGRLRGLAKQALNEMRSTLGLLPDQQHAGLNKIPDLVVQAREAGVNVREGSGPRLGRPQVRGGAPVVEEIDQIENVHDEGLEFEPIHRVLFGLKKDLFAELEKTSGAHWTYRPVASADDMVRAVDSANDEKQLIGLVGGGREFGVIEIAHASSNLPVGTLQPFLDAFLKEGGAEKIDYVHGGDVTVKLGSQPGNAGFYLPGMSKSDLFKTVILDGALPRKTFSMGEAREKRFYMEARKIA